MVPVLKFSMARLLGKRPCVFVNGFALFEPRDAVALLPSSFCTRVPSNLLSFLCCLFPRFLVGCLGLVAWMSLSMRFGAAWHANELFALDRVRAAGRDGGR